MSRSEELNEEEGNNQIKVHIRIRPLRN